MRSPTERIPDNSREVLDDIRRLVQTIRNASRESEKSVGLSAAQLFVLHKLGEENGLSVNDLAERTLTHQSSVSVIVQKLVAKGLIKRIRPNHDARKLELSLTKKGNSVIKKVPHTIQDRLIEALKKMKPDMRRQLALTLTIFLHSAGIQGKASLLFDDFSLKKRSKK